MSATSSDSVNGVTSDLYDSHNCVFKDLRLGSSFDSYEEFEQALQEFQRRTFSVFTVCRSNKLQDDDPMVDSLKYKNAEARRGGPPLPKKAWPRGLKGSMEQDKPPS